MYNACVFSLKKPARNSTPEFILENVCDKNIFV